MGRFTPRILGVTVFITLLLIYTPLHYSIAVYALEEGEYKRIVVHAPAVSEVSGREVGAILNITITVTPGNGKIFVSTTPLSMIDMQASARIAVLVACRLLKINPFKYNFYFEINAPALIVGGPSAGAALTIGVFSLLSNIPLRKDVMITGMINPDGTIGPVGGIVTKLKAAADYGVKVFLIPLGQRYTTVKKVETRKIGPIVEQIVRVERVDVVEYGRKLGVKVIEVGSITNAIKYFTGYEIPEPRNLTEPKIPEALNERLRENTQQSLNTVKSLISELKRETPLEVRSYLREATRLLNLAIKSIDRGDYYTALSYLFNSKIHLYFIRYYVRVGSGESLERIVGEVENYINYVEEVVHSINVSNILLLEIVSAASWRVRVAKDLLDKAKDSLKSGDYRTALENLAFAYARAETALDWLKLIVPLESILFDYNSFKRIVESYLYEARTVVAYARTVIEEMGLTSQLYNLLSQAVNNLSWAEEALNGGDLYLALEASCNSIVYATSALSLAVTSREALQYQFEHSRSEALKTINMVQQYNVTPVASTLYYMRAKAEVDPVTAIILYKMSAIHANTILSLILLGSGGRVVVEKPEVPLKTPTPAKPPTPTITPTVKQPIKLDRENILVLALSAIAVAIVILALRSIIVMRRERTVYY